MPRKPNPLPDDAAQADRFLEAAKELDADKTGAEFKRALELVIPLQVSKQKGTKSRKKNA